MTSPTSKALHLAVAALTLRVIATSFLVALSPFPLFLSMLLLPLNSIDLTWPSWLLSLYSVDIPFFLLSTLSLLLLRLP